MFIILTKQLIIIKNIIIEPINIICNKLINHLIKWLRDNFQG